MLEIGKIIKWTEKGHLSGLMEEVMKENIRMIKSMVKVYSHGNLKIYLLKYLGLTEESIMECGKWVSNMEKDISIMLKPKHGNGEFGMKEKELDGFNLNKYGIIVENNFC